MESKNYLNLYNKYCGDKGRRIKLVRPIWTNMAKVVDNRNDDKASSTILMGNESGNTGGGGDGLCTLWVVCV